MDGDEKAQQEKTETPDEQQQVPPQGDRESEAGASARFTTDAAEGKDPTPTGADYS